MKLKRGELHGGLLFHTLGLFLVAQLLGFFVGRQLMVAIPSLVPLGESVGLFTFLGYFILGTTFFLVMLKVYRGVVLYKLLFYLVLVAGLVMVFELVFQLPVSIVVALSFVFGLVLLPVVWVHNLAIIIASAGLGAAVGLHLSWKMAIIFMLILSVYDVVAVYVTRHMIYMAHAMLERRAIFALIVPSSFRGYYAQVRAVYPTTGFLILGGGDVILPILLAISVSRVSMASSFFVIGGALCGIVINHFILVYTQKPIPALPALALGSLLGLFIGFAF